MPVRKKTHTDYKSRINDVYDYIENNIGKDISLEDLAFVSNFSKYHFSRIFEAMVGETPFEFIKRVRLEKAATLLRMNPGTTVTEIALNCGFNDLAVFSRNFRDYFGKSPTKWRNSIQENSNHNQTFETTSVYLDSELNRNNNMEQLQSAKVTHFSDLVVAYIRHTGPYQGDAGLFYKLFNRLFSWTRPRGLMERPNASPLVIYHDDPCVTEKEKLRMSICLPVPPDTPVNDEIGKMKLPGGRFLSARFIVFPHEMPKAWQWIYGSWFPASGYQPADQLPFEA